MISSMSLRNRIKIFDKVNVYLDHNIPTRNIKIKGIH